MNPKKERVPCRHCGNTVDRLDAIYCSRECFNQSQYVTYIQRWKMGIEKGYSGKVDIEISNHVRNYMLDKAGYACEVCGFDKTHPVTGRTILVVHHIDGDATHCSESNLQVLCPNCHALTDNHGGYNRGNGRKARLAVLV